jgi:putative membrane protein
MSTESKGKKQDLNLLDYIKFVIINWRSVIDLLFYPGWKRGPNVGSLARDTLASERTFLSWFRIGVHVMLFGLITVIFLNRKTHSTKLKIIGAMLIVLGMIFILHAWIKHTVEARLFRAKILATKNFGIYLATIIALIIFTFVLLVISL